MKKLIALLLAAVMCFALTACGNSDGQLEGTPTNTPPSIEESVPSLSETEEETAQEVADENGELEDNTSLEDSIEEFDVVWSEVSYIDTDQDGYQYEIIWRFSPWILLSNEDIIKNIWDDIGQGSPLPQFDDWGLKNDSGLYYRSNVPGFSILLGKTPSQDFFGFRMNYMYYCLGTVQIRNITEGWSINENNSRSFYAQMQWDSVFKSDITNTAYIIGRTFYKNGNNDAADGLLASAKLTHDNWGPVPFVLMAPENISPNNPDGEYYSCMPKGHIRFGAWKIQPEAIQLGVIGKNGEYLPPFYE